MVYFPRKVFIAVMLLLISGFLYFGFFTGAHRNLSDFLFAGMVVFFCLFFCLAFVKTDKNSLEYRVLSFTLKKIPYDSVSSVSSGWYDLFTMISYSAKEGGSGFLFIPLPKDKAAAMVYEILSSNKDVKISYALSERLKRNYKADYEKNIKI